MRKEVSSKNTIDNEIEYKHRKAIAKREIRKRHRKSWEQFKSHFESDIYKIKPNTFKLLKHMNKYIKESANIHPGPSKETFLHNYKEIWTSNSLQEHFWNTENVDDKIITMEELKEALTNKEWKVTWRR